MKEVVCYNISMKNINYTKNTLFIDESGNPGAGGRFFVIGIVSFQSNKDYKKLSRIIQKTIRGNTTLRIEGEMKGFNMGYKLKKEVLRTVDAEGRMVASK